MVQLGALKHHAAKAMPAAVLAYLRKRKRLLAAAQRRHAREALIARHGQFGAAELAAVLQGMGITAGCVLFVQSSFNDLHTFAGRPADLLRALRALPGPQGTLLMPAYTTDAAGTAAAPLDVTHLPTYTGIVNELFRRTPGVLRSLHPRHSLCAEGPLASSLLAGHEQCLYADGAGSPLDRLRLRDDALIVTLGLAPGFTSFLHWVEDIEPGKLPMQVHEPAAQLRRVQHPDGYAVEVRDMHVRAEVASRLDLQPLARALGPDVFQTVQHRGVLLGLYFVKPLSQQLLALRDRGIFHYR